MSMKKQLLIYLIGFVSIGLFGQSMNIGTSLYSDHKARQTGDVITVLIVENANASQESKINSSTTTTSSVDGSVSGQFGSGTGFLPLFSASGNLGGRHDGIAKTSQQDQLLGKLSVTITEVTPGGLFRIHGKRTVEVNGEKNLMELDGTVRPRDIRSDNTVYSYKIADAQIRYKKSGLANKIMKPGTMKRWTTTVLALGLLGLAFAGGLK